MMNSDQHAVVIALMNLVIVQKAVLPMLQSLLELGSSQTGLWRLFFPVGFFIQ